MNTFSGSCLREVAPGPELIGPRHALRLEVARVEEAAHAGVRVVHHLPVHPLEVEGETERLAHARILELRAPRIDEESLEVAGVLGRQLGLDELAGIEFLADVGTRPFTRRESPQVIELPGLEGLGLRRRVLVDLVGDAVEVIAPAAHVQIPRPVVGIALKGDVAAEVHAADLVGTARGLECPSPPDRRACRRPRRD